MDFNKHNDSIPRVNTTRLGTRRAVCVFVSLGYMLPVHMYIQVFKYFPSVRPRTLNNGVCKYARIIPTIHTHWNLTIRRKALSGRNGYTYKTLPFLSLLVHIRWYFMSNKRL
jgi:hypothetical protein